MKEFADLANECIAQKQRCMCVHVTIFVAAVGSGLQSCSLVDSVANCLVQAV